MEKNLSPVRPAYYQSILPPHPQKPIQFGQFPAVQATVFYADDPQSNANLEIMQLEHELRGMTFLDDARDILKICLRIEAIKNMSRKQRNRHKPF